MKTQKDLRQAILDIILEHYHKCYYGPLKIKKLPEGGWDVALGLDCYEKPIHIAAQLDDEQFLIYFCNEIRRSRLAESNFYTGYRTDYASKDPFYGYPIDHSKCDKQYTNI